MLTVQKIPKSEASRQIFVDWFSHGYQDHVTFYYIMDFLIYPKSVSISATDTHNEPYVVDPQR